MAKFRIITPVDFGNFTILGKSGLQSDQVPINNYAPKVGEIVEGALETKPISDGNGNTMLKTGITWVIKTNGSASTQGQTSVQFISIDHLETSPNPSGDGQDNNNLHPADPVNPNDPNTDTTDNTTIFSETCGWICKNKVLVILGVIILLIIIIISSND